MAAPPPPFSPTTGTVMDTVMTQPSWSLLATAINTLLPPDTVSFLMKPPAGSGYTLFAPDNAAFEATALLLGLTGGGAELLADPLLPDVLEAQISTVTFRGVRNVICWDGFQACSLLCIHSVEPVPVQGTCSLQLTDP